MGFGDKKGSLQILFGGLVNPIIFVFAISQYLSVGCYTNIAVTKDKPFFLADYLLSVIFHVFTSTRKIIGEDFVKRYSF